MKTILSKKSELRRRTNRGYVHAITELIKIRRRPMITAQRTGAKPSLANFPSRPLSSHRLVKILRAFVCAQRPHLKYCQVGKIKDGIETCAQELN